MCDAISRTWRAIVLVAFEALGAFHALVAFVAFNALLAFEVFQV